MQKLRDSTNVKRYATHIHELEKRAKSLAEALFFFFENRVKDRLIISYSGLGYLPAHVLYSFMLTMDPDKHVILEDCNTVLHYIVPYRENLVSILFSTSPRDPSINSFLQTSRLMGNETLLVINKPREERLKQIYSSFNTVMVDADSEIEASVYMSIATYYACTKLYAGRLGFRGTRLSRHGEEGLSIVVEDLIAKYLNVLENIVSDKPTIISSPSFLKPVSIFIRSVLYELGLNTYYEELDVLSRNPHNILLLATSVDERIVRRARFSLGPADIKVSEIILNSDPLEAHIYLMILFYYLIFTLKQKRE